jgi:peptidoglycan/xylan/chitin deacetylase (PgdA/CDA1 family)
MHYRSFFLGWAALVFGLGCVVLGIVFVVRPRVDTMIVPTYEAPVNVENSSVTSTVAPIVPLVASTGTAALHAPPVRYLSLVKGEPKLLKDEVAIQVPVLMYHHIRKMKPTFTSKDRQYSVTPEHFQAQMEGLVRAGYTTITPRELEDAIEGVGTLPKKPVLLTFDDGYREHYTIVLPILKQLNLKATYFIISGVTKVNAHMSVKMIQEADQTGLITIASHTREHPFLARLSSAGRVSQIVGSKKDLEEIVGHPIYDFAYPFGSWNQAVANEVEAAGYTLGFGIRLGSIHGNSSRYQLRRIRVLDGEDIVPMLDLFSKPHSSIPFPS